jgi:hypothetical protein
MSPSVPASDFAGLPILRGYSFKGVRIPLNVNPHIKSDIFLEIKQIDIQAKKFDFFALSSVPQMVFQGVRIIIDTKTNPALTLKTLAEFSNENPQFQSGRMEGVSLVDSSGNILLSANQGSVSRSGVALMLHGVSLNPDKQEIIKEGRLDLIGPDSGKLFWEHAGKQLSRNVLSPAQ